MKNIFEALKNTVTESDVQGIYTQSLKELLNVNKVEHPYQCDSLIETEDKQVKLIVEYKYDEDLSSKMGRASVLIQVLYYLKRFEQNGELLPNVCMVADKNECFCLHINDLIDFLNEDIDWNIAPSNAARMNNDLVVKIAESINPFVFNIVSKDFDFKNVIDKIKDLGSNVSRLINITEHNIDNIFNNQFLKNVVKNTKKLDSKDFVSIFLGIIIDHEHYYKHPSKKNILVTPKGSVEINGSAFDSFFSYFNKEYSPKEIDNLTKIADRLIEDKERRNSGDFWTPTPFVDYAHKMISEQLGEDWRDEYIVWDNCCGAKNLTRDYKFKELYCSTLFDSELEIGSKYNKEATTFQFDFLNDPEDKLPEGLLNAFKENKKIVFFLNPPYARSTGNKNSIANGIASLTLVNAEMKKEKLDGSELIKQFLYRIAKIKSFYNLTNCVVACFTKPSWLMKPQSEKFRKLWLSEFEFINGIMFQASEFADCSNMWGITFNIWKSGETENKNEFLHTLVENTEDGIRKIGDKLLYNVDNIHHITANEYLCVNSTKAEQNIIVCDDIKAMSFKKITAKAPFNYIAAISGSSSDIQHNRFFHIANKDFTIVKGQLPLTKSNFINVCIINTIKNIIVGNWVNDKDQYNMNVDIPDQFKYDCLVYTIFSNYCCGIRLEDGSRLKNEFFWMSKDEILDLANANNNNECYQDARTDSDRYMYSLIKEHYNELSDDAKAILESGKELVRKSFQRREPFNDEESKYQINNWDAGWYQIKALCKMFCPNDLKLFQQQYKAFADKLRPMVYEIGFLKK